MIEFQNVSHVVEAVPGREISALRNVSLRIEQGEYVALMGPNGSGKSTLVRHMNALLMPSRGTVRVNEFDTRDGGRLWDIRQHVGMIFQNPDHQMVATVVEEEVAFGPENLGLPRDEIIARVEEALKVVDMLAWRRHNPAHLSGGQKQRIAIASILAMRPRVLVADEPTAMLDAAGRRDILAILRRLHEDSRMTIVHITHSMDEAHEASRVLVMRQGGIALDGALNDLDPQQFQEFGIMPSPLMRIMLRLADAGMALPKKMSRHVDDVVRAVLAWSPTASADTMRAVREAPPAGAGLAVSLRDLHFTYMRGTPFETPALRGVSLELPASSRAAVMGSTGCGKTTLMQHLNGLLRATEGEVMVGRHRLASDGGDVRAVRREVGMAFQFAEHQLFEETVARDVAYGPNNQRLTKLEVDVRVRRALDRVGLSYDEYAERNPLALSGGEMRRVALAGVIAMEPRLLVLDEPTAGLDAHGQAQVQAIVSDVQAQGTSTLIVSHDVELVVDLADRLLLLDEGRLMGDGAMVTLLGGASLPPGTVPRPAANEVARALLAAGMPLDETVVRGDMLAQEVIRVVMKAAG